MVNGCSNSRTLLYKTGDFSVEYLFPDNGTHQVLTKISKDNDVQVLASFNVFVPHQAPPSLLNPFPNAAAMK